MNLLPISNQRHWVELSIPLSSLLFHHNNRGQSTLQLVSSCFPDQRTSVMQMRGVDVPVVTFDHRRLFSIRNHLIRFNYHLIWSERFFNVGGNLNYNEIIIIVNHVITRGAASPERHRDKNVCREVYKFNWHSVYFRMIRWMDGSIKIRNGARPFPFDGFAETLSLQTSHPTQPETDQPPAERSFCIIQVLRLLWAGRVLFGGATRYYWGDIIQL